MSLYIVTIETTIYADTPEQAVSLAIRHRFDGGYRPDRFDVCPVGGTADDTIDVPHRRNAEQAWLDADIDTDAAKAEFDRIIS